MLRDILLISLLVIFGIYNALQWKKKNQTVPKRKALSLIILLTLFFIELAYIASFTAGYRLPNNSFCIFSLFCLISNFAFSRANNKNKTTCYVLSLLLLLLSSFCYFSISQTEIVIDGKQYIGEYSGWTGISNTLVDCYEVKNGLFTENKADITLDYGIILDGAPDFDEMPYSIVDN